MTTKYIEYGVNLNESQINKIKNAVNATSIYLTKKNLHGDHKLPLTQTQVNKLSNFVARTQSVNNTKTGVYLKLSAAQLKAIKTGGFLPLLTLIPLIAGAVGAAGGLTGGISAAVSAAKSNAEQQRHNKVIEEQLGTGLVSDTISKVPVLGPFLGPLLKRIGLGLNDINEVEHGSCICKKGLLMKKIGNGLYLEPEGSGVFLDPRGSQ
jgi:hypothetical protein